VFSLNGSVLDCAETANDLGIWFDPGLTFAAHIDNIRSKAFQRSYLIFKSFQSRDRCILTNAFKTYVRPLVEANSSVWSPHFARDVRGIEAVQRRFTKKLNGLYNTSYPERLSILGLERLDVRRLRFDLILAYKLLFGLTALNSSDFFVLSNVVCTRGHSHKLALPRCNTDTRKYFFSVRTVKIWNDLPATTDFSHLISFKRSLFNVDLAKYCINL
jgi:hypothetical protein